MARSSGTAKKKKVRARRSDARAASNPPNHFINRELSWLEFNRRVLCEATNPRTPLLERVRFLSICTSNLDEFFMKRVGGLKQQISAGVVHTTPDGMTPLQELIAIRQAVVPILVEQARIYTQELVPLLAQNGVHLARWETLSQEARAYVQNYYRTHVFPILTPLSVDPGHPFPYLSNLSTSLGIVLQHPDKPGEKWFARVKVPEILPPWIKVEIPSSGNEVFFISLRDTILHNLAELFPGMTISGTMSFRITRNAEVELDELDAEDLLDHIESELRERRFAKVVRLEHCADADPWILGLLRDELELVPDDLYDMPAKLDYTALKPIYELNRPALKYEPWIPAQVPILSDEDSNIFNSIRHSDYLVHHPYESFVASVERFVREAKEDPKVVGIKMTLYRTGEQSSIVPLLIAAAEAGKQVVCVIELKAHFDEARNIAWAQAMEKAGVHVIYGLVGLKTHAKTILIMRQETEGVRCYAHVGSGNYHAQNAGFYTDVSLFTAKPEITAELVEVFNFLTGRSLKRDYATLLVSPFSMKDRFLALIDREAEHARQGRPAHIIAKMNSLEDHGIISALYKASQAGVKIDLMVRGLCCLRPNIPGLSEGIRVISVIGRLLEHSRIFYFRNGNTDPVEGEFFLGSADWMYRNLLSRVEVVAPLLDRSIRERCYEILLVMANDLVQSWQLQLGGGYERKPLILEPGKAAPLGCQEQLMRLSRERLTRYLQTAAEHTGLSPSLSSDQSRV